ncbi:MAG: hypothetical protein O2960_28575 [Verrucomicrobia bacterium]|nr:hypothetical protein [Verrucomicrobiota bacterium]
MKTPAEVIQAVTAVGGRLEPLGDKLRILLPVDCSLELKAAIRAHKPAILALLEGRAASLTPDCVPWLHVARQVLSGEFDGADGSTVKSLATGLRAVDHPDCQRAIERLGLPGKRRSK